MFACICRAVTCDQVSAAIEDGAATLKAVAKATRACTGCGTCRERIANMLAERKPAGALETVPLEMAPAAMAPAAMAPAAITTVASAEALSAGMLAAQPGNAQSLAARALSAA